MVYLFLVPVRRCRAATFPNTTMLHRLGDFGAGDVEFVRLGIAPVLGKNGKHGERRQ
jgi:hypothetical protein